MKSNVPSEDRLASSRYRQWSSMRRLATGIVATRDIIAETSGRGEPRVVGSRRIATSSTWESHAPKPGRGRLRGHPDCAPSRPLRDHFAILTVVGREEMVNG